MLAVYGYHAYNYYVNGDSMYIHRPQPELSTAENLLQMLRPDRSYTPLEAHVLDTALLLHMEHGGGNNSTFTTRVVTSSGSDTYSVMSAALCSLKGPKHGGANIKVVEMVNHIRGAVHDETDEDEVKDYLSKILDKQAFDHKGLIYGMGHAVYSLSDPRAVVFKSYVQQLAEAKDRKADFDFYNMIERLARRSLPKNATSTRAFPPTSTSIPALSTTCWISLSNFTPRSSPSRASSAGAPTGWRSLSMWTRSSARPMQASWNRANISRLNSAADRKRGRQDGIFV